MLEIIDGFVDSVSPLVEEGGIEPRSGIVWIEAFGEAEFFGPQFILASGVVGFAEITAQHGSIRFQSCRHEQILPAFPDLADPESREATAKPCVGQGGIQGDGLVEFVASGSKFTLCCQDEALRCQCLGILGAQTQSSLNCLLCLQRMPK